MGMKFSGLFSPRLNRGLSILPLISPLLPGRASCGASSGAGNVRHSLVPDFLELHSPPVSLCAGFLMIEYKVAKPY